MAERVLIEKRRGLCTLTLDRPEKRNALDTATFDALDAAIGRIAADEEIGCVVLRGAGRSFCAGADLGAVGADADRLPDFKPRVIERLAGLAVPSVAAIHSACFTGGLELALACDFLIADATARFADTLGQWGFVGAWGMSQRLPRRVGMARAKRMMMTSRIVEAPEADAIGLIDLLVPEGGLNEAVAGFTAEILANSPHTNREVKRFLIATDGMPLAAALAHERDHHPGLAPDWQERIARFGRRR